MKIKKLFILLSSMLAISACNFNNTPGEETPSDGKVIINGFNNVDDLYRCKQLLNAIHYGVDCDLDITNDKLHSGDGSLHITYNNGIYGQIYQRNALSPIKDEDMSDVAKFGGWFYNDNDFDTTIVLSVVGLETEIISSYEVSFPKKQWINPEYVLNKVSMNAVKDEVRGFSFRIGSCESYPASFYADELYVTFGAKNTAEDDIYLEKINELIAEIDSLPDIIKPNDSVNIAKCKDIATKYSEIPTVYRAAITNYQTYVLALQTYVDAIADQSATDSDVIAYHFDSCFALAQISFSYTQTEFKYGITDEKVYNNQEGSLKLSFEGNVTWALFNATSTVNMQDYDYLEFAIYNDTPAQIAFCLTWDTTHYVKPGQWEEVRVSTNYASFMPSYLIEWEFTSSDNEYYEDGEARPIVGDVYVSQVTLHRASASTFLEMLDSLPTTITSDNEEQVEEIRNYYNNLHKDEKAKISEANYNRLLQAERAVQTSYFTKLSAIIDALPSVSGIKAYNGTFINKAYKVYSIMTNAERNQYLSYSQKQKIVSLYETYNQKYQTVIPANNLTGEDIGISWDVRANAAKRLDATYGDVVDYKISSLPENGLNGAFEFLFNNVDVTSFDKVVFYVYAPHADTLYLSRSAWRGGDSNKGYALEKNLVANTWNEVIIDADDFGECSYIELYFHQGIELNDTYTFTSFYGVINA